MIEAVTLFIVLPAVGLALALAGLLALRGPHMADRILAVDLATTVLVGGVVGLSLLTHQAVLLDVALIVALVAFLGTLALARLLERRA